MWKISLVCNVINSSVNHIYVNILEGVFLARGSHVLWFL